MLPETPGDSDAKVEVAKAVISAASSHALATFFCAAREHLKKGIAGFEFVSHICASCEQALSSECTLICFVCLQLQARDKHLARL